MLDDRYALAYRAYPYARSRDQDAAQPVRHPVVVLGGGPVGMALALDLARQDIPVLVLDDHEGVGLGSRAICFAKRTLEIAHRHGCGTDLLEQGIVWNLGKVFHRDRKVYQFNLLPEEGHRFPAFINLGQPAFELCLIERLRKLQAQGAPVEIRGRNRVKRVDVRGGHVSLTVVTPDGPYRLEADWLIGCDGARSFLRESLGLGFEGRVFRDSFLIADIRMPEGSFPTERWFWFDPPFRSAGASALLHRQPDDIWRVDFQIGGDVDRTEELKEENIRARLDAMLGPKVRYDLVWSSIYTFQCKRMDRFRQGRVIFAGDAAHQVSPFGARGANSGIQDIDNLGWKLGLVLKGLAPDTLLDSYDAERLEAADENIRNSTRSTDFITPKSEVSQLFREAVLHLSRDHAFARPLVNSGRLSVPCVYDGSPLSSADDLLGGPARTRPGAPCPDAPMGDGYLLDTLGDGFVILGLGTKVPDRMDEAGLSARVLKVPNHGITAPLRARYLGDAPSAVYLVRPDQHVAYRATSFDDIIFRAALRRATGQETGA